MNIVFASEKGRFFLDEVAVAKNETTGIFQMEEGRWKKEEVVYDMQGRRVAQPTKGLYIVNGKKLFIK